MLSEFKVKVRGVKTPTIKTKSRSIQDPLVYFDRINKKYLDELDRINKAHLDELDRINKPYLDELDRITKKIEDTQE